MNDGNEIQHELISNLLKSDNNQMNESEQQLIFVIKVIRHAAIYFSFSSIKWLNI